MDSLKHKYGDSLVFVYYFADRAIEIPAGAVRGRWYYGYQQWPWAVFGGRSGEQVTNPDSFYTAYDAQIFRSRTDSTPIELRLDSAGTVVAPPVVKVNVRVNPTDSTVNDMRTLALVAVVYEDSVAFERFPGDTVWVRMLARAVAADTWGIPLTLRFGQEFDTVLEVSLGPWRADRLGVAAFVQDTATKEVLQAVVRHRIAVGD